jgi:hypothetical protein
MGVNGGSDKAAILGFALGIGRGGERYFSSYLTNTCGSAPAREGAGTFNTQADGATAFASRLAPMVYAQGTMS